jgi:hypothetical protein
MHTLSEQLKWCRAERDELLDSICQFESGAMRISENRGSSHVDVTAEWVTRWKKSVEEIDSFISAYEEANASRSK